MSCSTEIFHENLNIPDLQKCFDALHLSEGLHEINQVKNEKILVANSFFNIQSSADQDKLELLKNQYEVFLHLKNLNISCGLTKTPNTIFKFKYLTVLNLSNNFLETLPDQIGALCNLKTLKLSHNKLNYLPKSLKDILQLYYLDISNNKFCQVPDILFYGLGSLRILDLSCNAISTFDGPPRCLNKLCALGLSNNLLLKLPFWFFDSACQLQFLYVNGNQLHMDFDPANYYNNGIFESLKLINLENCDLKYKDIRILSFFKNLNVLKVGNKNSINAGQKKRNYMGNLKMDIFKNSLKMMHLYLQNSQIASLPSDFDCLKGIEVLDLSDNILFWLPESFCNLTNLKILNLASNHLMFLPNNIDKLDKLQEIHLGNNKLNQIPESFYNLKNLEFIDLYNNELNKFDWSILKERKLKGLDLEMNFFNFNTCELGIDEISIIYLSFKNEFRKHFNCVNTRSDFQKSNIGCEEKSDSYSGSTRWSISSAEFESDIEESPLKVSDKDNFLDENWEEKGTNESEDDLFDPNEQKKFEQPYNVWSLNFGNNYCPAKYHMPSVKETYEKNSSSNETTVEGQFDSD